MKNGNPAPVSSLYCQGGEVGEASEWAYRSLVLALALERGSRATTPWSQDQDPGGRAQGAAARGSTLKSSGHETETGFLIKAKQGIKMERSSKERHICGSRLRFSPKFLPKVICLQILF